MNPIREVFIGFVAPLGTDLNEIVDEFEKSFEKKGYEPIVIKMTDLVFPKIGQGKDAKQPLDNLTKSLKYFTKMEVCSELREFYGNGFLATQAIKAILEKRRKNDALRKGQFIEPKTVVYLINQIKNLGEYELLSNIYDINYIQISCSSNERKRDAALKKKFEDDKLPNECANFIKEFEKFLDCDSSRALALWKAHQGEAFLTALDNMFTRYQKDILPDAAHKLLEKDKIDPQNGSKTGQQLAKLFHESHYFINANLSQSEIKKQVNKFIDLLSGEYDEFPTQEEFGMMIANSAALRSNFPGDRQIGCCIISENGEVISAGSIRSPSASSNPVRSDQDHVSKGYKKFKDKIENWKEFLLEDRIKNCKYLSQDDKDKIKGIESFLNDSIDFHPCTHAEVSALLDAAKLGVSVRGATMYTTTFPCHLCAKDIITAGISKVVFCEEYPKSKNDILYPNSLRVDPGASETERVPFKTFEGVGPKRYHYVYNLKNRPPTYKKSDKEKEPGKEKAEEKAQGIIPPMLKYRYLKNYDILETLCVAIFDNDKDAKEMSEQLKEEIQKKMLEQFKEVYKDKNLLKPPKRLNKMKMEVHLTLKINGQTR